MVSLKIDKALLRNVERFARKMKWTRSEIIRMAIEMLISELYDFIEEK